VAQPGERLPRVHAHPAPHHARRRRPELTLPRPSVLVVEDRADRPVGHWPILFADVATGFAAAGCRVEALTARGRHLTGTPPLPFPVHEYGRIMKVVERLAAWLERDRARPDRRRRWPRRAGEVLRVVVLTRTAAARARKLGDDTVVVVVSNVDAPEVIGAVGGRGRWLSYVSFAPRRRGTWGRLVGRLAARVERTRRARGGRSVVGAPTRGARDQWARAWPELEVVELPLPGIAETRPVAGARAQLGLDPSLRIALLFGMHHAEKDPATVFEAFADLDDWHLVVAGTVADEPPPGARVLRCHPGYVDDRTRALLLSAADLIVVSYHPGFARESWNLRDAIAYGVPVVCSDRSAPAELVRAHRLGVVFEAGDAASLARAVRDAPAGIDPADLARARAEVAAGADLALRAVGVRSS
jgi:glycosyltransferase involved in cell wall biosynthesis